MYKYLCIGISSVTLTGDRNKYKFAISTNMYISCYILNMKNAKIRINDFTYCI